MCEFIRPCPATAASAGNVPSSAGPLATGRSSANATPANAPINATHNNFRRIRPTPLQNSERATLPRSEPVVLADGFAACASIRFASGDFAATRCAPWLYLGVSPPYTHSVAIVAYFHRANWIAPQGTAIFVCAVLVPACALAQAQQEKTSEKKSSAESSAQIELLETHVRFEANGDSRKEVHTRAHINNELGVREFGRLTFDYNRGFEQIEIPFLRITHAGGGTADILPSAITDEPNPAVVNAPAYQNVRRKAVRILGLQPSDTLEYRVVTTVSHHPLAPDFWLAHSFDRSGVVSQEIFELDLPALPQVQIRINSNTPADSEE
ncbi:MAG: hypothetical protein DMG33_04745, partial [Acidobacteria bacterium]